MKHQCVFTTHTPVPAGHDRFPIDLARKVLGHQTIETLRTLQCCDTELNMTLVGLQLSHYINGVTKRHGEVSRSMFPGYPVGSITNGVHSATWTAPSFRALYDRHIPDWRRNNFSLRYAVSLPLDAVREAHREAKRRLLHEINERTNAGFAQHAFTVGFARRSTAYKRPTLIFHDADRLRRIAVQRGPLQLVFAGKAHPRDDEGKTLIEAIFRWQKALRPEVKIAYLANYDLDMAALLTAGVDLWLNTPRPPYEASGTSGMKAAHNGVPSLSVLDGWWCEGHVAAATGWAIAGQARAESSERPDDSDARELYGLLEEVILPLFYEDAARWTELMRSTIALNASFFNTHRMLQEYLIQAYQDRDPTVAEEPAAF